jgi:hypothetical protein
MISLIALPVLLIPFTVAVCMAGDFRMLTIIALRENGPERNYLNIRLTGDERTDQIKLDFGQLLVAEIAVAQDTLRGVHYILGDTVKYKSLVRIINDFNLSKNTNYVFDTRQIWCYYIKPRIEISDNIIHCGTSDQTLCAGMPTIEDSDAVSMITWCVIMGSFGFLAITTFSTKKTDH